MLEMTTPGDWLKVSADKERKMSNYDGGWNASGLRMRPIGEDGD
jgi:hypothetical protein